MMKKLALSAGVVLTFIAYSFNQRGDGGHPKIIPPTLPLTNTTGSTSPSSNNSAPATAPGQTTTSAQFKNGNYTGSAADAYYGYIQVQAIISGGKLSDVQFLQYPNDQQNSLDINSQAMPYLKQEAIAAQSAQVNVISGATDTSMAFIQSLTNALNQAKL